MADAANTTAGTVPDTAEAGVAPSFAELASSVTSLSAMRELMVRLEKTHRQEILNIRASQVQAAAPRVERVKFNNPAAFDGKREDLQAYLFQVELRFASEPQAFVLETTKVAYAVGFLKGDALRWVLPVQRLSLDIAFPTYLSFRSALCRAFGDPNEEETAEREIRMLRQKGSCASYTTEFLRLSGILGWDEKAMRSQYKMGLSDEVKDQLIHVETGVTLAELYRQAELIDGRIYARKREKVSAPVQGIDRSLKSRITPQPWGKRVVEKRSEIAFPRAANNGPIPMEIDNTQATSRGYRDAEKNEHRRLGKCFSCSKVGHLARDCPTLSKN